jgi:hypothetical protein
VQLSIHTNVRIEKGLQRFSKDGYNVALKEKKQLHGKLVFKLVNVDKLTKQEKRRTMNSLIF